MAGSSLVVRSGVSFWTYEFEMFIRHGSGLSGTQWVNSWRTWLYHHPAAVER